MLDIVKDWLYSRNFNVVGWRRVFGSISAVVVVISWMLFFAIGPNWGIDFTGGTEIHLEFMTEEELREEKRKVPDDFDPEVSIDTLRGALTSLGLDSDSVQQVGASEDNEFSIRIQNATFGADAMREDVERRLLDHFGSDFIDPDRTKMDAEVGARLVIGYNPETVDLNEVRPLFDDLENAQVREGREDRQLIVQLPGLSTQIADQIQEVIPRNPFRVLATDAVGPKVGGELTRQGFISIFATLALVLIYIAFRFDLRFAPGAIVALVHDVSITIGIFVVGGMLVPGRFEFNLPMIGALLTIVGYSLNDTIVIYDRIRENRDRYRRKDTADLINVSVNETLARTLATSFTTMLAMLAFLTLGGPVIQDFAVAMMCGIIFGTYSTVFVASPMILIMEDVQPYLAKFVAVSAKEEVDEEEEEEQKKGMTRSERRRRERAERYRDTAEG